MTNQTERIELIRQANEILDRIDAALALPWFEEEAANRSPESLQKAA